VIKAVIFDVDGTLVDSNDLHVQAWQEAFRRYGKVVTYEELHQQMGKGGDQLMPVFCSQEELDRFGEQLEQSRAELFTTDYLPRVRPFPKVRELFERIKADGHSVSLASSAKEEELERHKKPSQLKIFWKRATRRMMQKSPSLTPIFSRPRWEVWWMLRPTRLSLWAIHLMT
jgi:beta-phosphoglucomutase-like phosphatase (HAD superfamily)